MIQLEPTKLYGVLHDVTTGAAVERQVRALKVGFSVPLGPDVHVFINAVGQWNVVCGDNTQAFPKDKRAEAQKCYEDARKTASKRVAPRKLGYFTFLRMGYKGDYVHDFDAIESHGPTPRNVDIVFLKDDPFEHQFQWWTATKLMCHGDGRNALRANELARSDKEKELVKIAEATYERVFPIEEGCHARGCPYSHGPGRQCKPHGRLYFQLADEPRIGTTCSYDTTGFRSTIQLASSIRQVRGWTNGRVAGVRLTLVVAPYKTSYEDREGNRKSSLQFGVFLEAKGENAARLAEQVKKQSEDYRRVLESHQIAAPAEPGQQVSDPGEPPQDEEVEAAAMAAEFYGDFPEEQNGSDLANGEDSHAHPEIKTPKRKSEQMGELEAARKAVGDQRFFFVLGNCGYSNLEEVPAAAVPSVVKEILEEAKASK